MSYQSDYYHRNKEKRQQSSREYYQRNKEKQCKKHREYYKNNKEDILTKERERYHTDVLRKLKCSLGRMRKITGCSLDELVDYYNTQFERQQGRCAICGRHELELNTRFHIDHNHNKNGIESLRSLLCSNCNSGIGNLRDDAELCLKAYQYLRSH